ERPERAPRSDPPGAVHPHGAALTRGALSRDAHGHTGGHAGSEPIPPAYVLGTGLGSGPRTGMKADDTLWRTYRQTRDSAVRDRLVEQHLVLVKYAAVRIAGRLPHHLGLDDLYSAGLFGFLAAIEDFDPDRGVEFAAYATRRIRGAIFDELR